MYKNWKIDIHNVDLVLYYHKVYFYAWREFLREILYNNIAIAIQHSKIYFVDTFGDFSRTVE